MSRLRVDQVRYLALEGGGGKGFAFLGAVAELESRGVINHSASGAPLGIAGSSAGAITATLVAAGMSASELKTLLETKNFDEFFDGPDLHQRLEADDPGQVPNVEAWWKNHQQEALRLLALTRVLKTFKGELTLTDVLTGFSAQVEQTVSAMILEMRQRDARQVVPPATVLRELDGAFQRWRGLLRSTALLLGAAPSAWDEHVNMAAIKALLEHPATFGASLATAGGLYPGISAWDWLDRLIAALMARRSGRPAVEHRRASFRDFFALFRCDLAITGTNLSTGKSEVFSRETTPQLPVATAVRISMGLPIIFKPVVITYADWKRMAYLHGPVGSMPKEKLVGSWIDGGVLNNLPVRVFESQARPDAAQHTLALRLDVEDLRLPQATPDLSPATQRRDTDGLMATLGALVGTFVGAGEAHITESWHTADQSIQLPTTGLNTLQFSPDKAAASASRKISRQTVADYFDRP